MIDRAAVVAEARSWISTPYHHGASLKGIGCDCIGFVRGVARHMGMHDPFATGAAARYQGYGPSPEPKALHAACAEFLVPIPRSQVLPGDILLIAFAEYPMHFAIAADRALPYMIHAWLMTKRVVENRIDDSFWRPKIVSAHRFPELA